MTMNYHLAQINIAQMKAPLTDASMQGFVDGLDPIHALADNAEGFVWRLQGDDGDATSIRAFDSDTILINLTVWTSVEALKMYVYQTEHVEYVRRRQEWFEQIHSHAFAMWWVPAGHIPTVEEAKERLEYLEAHGESDYAFTFRTPFDPPAAH